MKMSISAKITLVMALFLVIAGLVFSKSHYTFLGMAFMIMANLMDLRDRILRIEKKL